MKHLDFAKITPKRQARIPDVVLDELDLSQGDGLDFKKNPETGNVVIEKLDR
jgi:bifunctional DNA-binding transcriptional regulator/antitoxin component of YhaV-PrlF toxin-antitoxin module